MKCVELNSGWEFARAEWLEEPPTYIHYPGWLPAQVPGYVHLDLVANGVIEHPFHGLAEAGCQWVDEAEWCYRTQFRWDGASAPVRLCFAGLDTICTVSLNGTAIAQHDNMFLPLEIDVSDRLLLGENELRIDFQPAARVGRQRRKAYFEREGIDPQVKNFDERAFVRKAQYMFGWDWGPRLVSCGIWRPVRLEIGESEAPSVSTSSARVQIRRQPDEYGESFEFFVDGKPFWARGANWIPIHSFPCETKELRHRLEACKRMNINMLRVWGGGLYESEEFYDLCDELDILVWQDFPFACSYYPDDEAFREVVRKEAAYHVKRLRRHRCLALWCGNNENLTMWEGKWGGAAQNPQRFHGESLWTDLLASVVAEHDPDRPYIPTSPIGSPPGVENCNADGYGDSHYWDVWHGRGDWIHYADSAARFSSEFGFPSSCGAGAWEMVTSAMPKTIDPDGQTVRAHDKTGRPFEYLRDLIELHYPRSRNLEEWILFSQLNQRDAMRFAVEHYRRSEFCKGTLIWQLNDCWPVQSWALTDSTGAWKTAAHELTRLYSDVLVCLERLGDEVRIWGINDSDAPKSATVAFAAIHSTTGTRSDETSMEAELDAHSRRILFSYGTAGLKPRETILALNGVAYLLCEPKDLQLRCSPLAIRGGRLECDTPIVDLHSDSNFTMNLMLPGDSIPFEQSSRQFRSLAGIHPT